MKAKNKKRNIFLITAGCVFLAALTLGITFAYLTDNKDVDNVFTIGDVYLKIEEPSYPEDESDRIMVAYSKINKNPMVTNTGTNDEFVFMKVTVPLEDVTLVDADGKKDDNGKIKQEIFKLISNSNGAETQGNISYDPNWVFICDESTDNTHSYIFAYNKVLLASNNTTADTVDRVKTEALFDEVQLKSFIEGEISENVVEKIEIEAYGIQADKLFSINDLNPDSPTEQQLKDIYNIYVRQNGGTLINET